MAPLSPERTGRITASRVAAILGVSRYQSPPGVMREMVRQHYGLAPEFAGNFITAKGQRLEPMIRALYEESTGQAVRDAPFFIHPDIDWIGATPDGLVGEPGLIEMKLIGREYVHFSQRPDYEVQCRLQLAASGRDWCDLVMFHTPRDGVIERPWISRVENDSAWLDAVLPTLTEFHDRYVELTAPEEPDEVWLTPAEVDDRTDPDWEAAAQDFLDRQADKAAADAAFAEARDRLAELADGKSTRGLGVSVSVVPRAGSIDWPKVQKSLLSGVDLEPFRKAPSTVTTVRDVK